MQSFNRIGILRAATGFKREPLNLRDGGVAFISFLNFASGDGDMARQLQAAFFNATGKAPRNDLRATPEECGEYIDWLIQNHWGEAPETQKPERLQ